MVVFGPLTIWERDGQLNVIINPIYWYLSGDLPGSGINLPPLAVDWWFRSIVSETLRAAVKTGTPFSCPFLHTTAQAKLVCDRTCPFKQIKTILQSYSDLSVNDLVCQ
jgi:hypothetical protein